MEHCSDSSHSGLEDAYIGRRVREARTEHGMTQEELAGHVGVEHKHISQITAMIIRNDFRRIELVQLPAKFCVFLFIWHLNFISRNTKTLYAMLLLMIRCRYWQISMLVTQHRVTSFC